MEEEVIVMLIIYVVNYLEGVKVMVMFIELGCIVLMILRFNFVFLIFVMFVN